jgi:hypothetical protein
MLTMPLNDETRCRPQQLPEVTSDGNGSYGVNVEAIALETRERRQASDHFTI